VSSAASNLLGLLAGTDSTVSIALTVGEALVPVIVGVVKDIKSAVTGKTVEYTLVVQSTEEVLDQIIAEGQSDLTLINSELDRLGKPKLGVPE